jgi:alpha-N-arabinofuranosidase
MNKLYVNADLGTQKISRHIYGHFAEHLGRCIYDGLWVGEDSSIPNTRGWRNDLVAALKAINIPNLRWPGGCFADTYHWMDGIGPREKRPSIVNVHWGGTTESNHVGTHEFLDLCDQLGCEPYIAGNVGSGTVREMAEWLEYLTMPGDSPMANLRRTHGRKDPWPVTYWGVGNENWGCGGNMRPQYYADLYRQYASYCRHFGGGKLYKVACGLTDEWNEILMREAGRFMDGLSVHYYTVPGPWDRKGSATDFTVDEWRLTLQKAANIEGFIRQTSAVMDRYDPQRRVGIVMDEWGTWFDVEPGTNPGFLYQQNTIRDALVAGLSLNIFNNHAQRLHMANIAQTVNVLQAMALTEGPKMLLTPTYHVMEMYKAHQDATLLPSMLLCEQYAGPMPAQKQPVWAGQYASPSEAIGQISASASRSDAGNVLMTLCNLHHEDDADVTIDMRGMQASVVRGRVLTAPAINAMNTFAQPDVVKPQAFDDIRQGKTSLEVKLPPRSVVALDVLE